MENACFALEDEVSEEDEEDENDDHYGYLSCYGGANVQEVGFLAVGLGVFCHPASLVSQHYIDGKEKVVW